jgi:hypothetical protein
LAPEWGEFYEIAGPDRHLMDPIDWKIASGAANPARHFLFYFRDNTFECIAADWVFERVTDNALVQRLRVG